MTDADDAVVLDVIGRANPHIPQDSVSDEVLKALKSMPDKGPLARSLGITPRDLGLVQPVTGVWVEG